MSTWKKSDDDFLGESNPALSRQVTKKKLPGICEMAMGKATKANPSEHVSLTTTRCFTRCFTDAGTAVLTHGKPFFQPRSGGVSDGPQDSQREDPQRKAQINF